MRNFIFVTKCAGLLQRASFITKLRSAKQHFENSRNWNFLMLVPTRNMKSRLRVVSIIPLWLESVLVGRKSSQDIGSRRFEGEARSLVVYSAPQGVVICIIFGGVYAAGSSKHLGTRPCSWEFWYADQKSLPCPWLNMQNLYPVPA